MTEIMWIAIAVIAIALIAVGIFGKEKIKQSRDETPVVKKPSVMTARELTMYRVLLEAFPTTMWIVLAEVSFNKLIEGGNRSKFNKFVADFVICKKTGETVCVIELDDRTHDRKKVAERDAKKMDMFKAAKLAIVRFKEIPTALEAFKEVRKVAMFKAV